MDRRDQRMFKSLYDANRFQEAIKFLEARDSDYYAEYLKGICYIAQDNFELAAESLQVSLSGNSDFYAARLNLARVFFEMEKVNEAAYQVEHIHAHLTEFDKLDFEMRIGFTGESPKAVDLARQMAKVCDRESRFEISRTMIALLAADLIHEAETLANRIPSKSDAKEAYYRLANYYIDNQNLVSADQALMIAGTPERDFYQLSTYSRFLYYKRSPDCLTYAESARELRPNADEAAALVVDCLILLAEDKQAWKVCNEHLSTYPTSTQVQARKKFLETS